jgi:hypothetical protein
VSTISCGSTLDLLSIITICETCTWVHSKKSQHGSMDTFVKAVSGFFNSSFGTTEYACMNFFSLLGSFSNFSLATITCFSSKICEESNKEEQSDILALYHNSLGSIELIRRVSKGLKKKKKNFYQTLLELLSQ